MRTKTKVAAGFYSAVIAATLILFISIARIPVTYIVDIQQPIGVSALIESPRVQAVNVYVTHVRNGQVLAQYSNHNTLTTLAQDWIEDKISDDTSTDNALHISLSNDATSPTSAWTQLISEINANGLTRATGTYVNDGVGAWNVTKTFDFTGTQSAQCAGLQWSATPASNNNLFAAALFTQVNGISGDQLIVTWQLTATGS